MDATATAELEAELRSFVSLADGMPTCVVVFDVSDPTDASQTRVRFANAAARRLFGARLRVGGTFEDGVPSELAALKLRCLALAGTDQTTLVGELVVGLPERGTGRTLLGRLFAMAGASVGFCGEDVSALKAREEQLRRTVEELARSNADLDDFAHIAAHDLRAPLRGIRGYASFVATDHADALDVEGTRKLGRIEVLCERLDQLLDALLHSSRVGRTDLAVSPTDLRALAEEVVDRLGPAVEAEHVTISIAEDLPTIACDRIRVGEVFHNLVTNALQYNASDRPRVDIGWREDHPRVRGPVLFVRDNGIGIDGAHREQVFEMFERVHARDAYGPGTGSGLSISKKLVERHGGSIWVESTLDSGSTFFFTLGPAPAPEA